MIKYESRDEYNINSTVNISQGGVLIKSKSPISINSHLVARMTLPTSHQEVIIVSRVVRVEHIRSEDIYLIALHFSSMDIEDSRRLIRFIKSLKG